MNTPVSTNSNSPTPLVRPVPPDQLSPKAVLLQVFKLRHVFKRYWKLIVGLMVVGGIIGKIIDISEERKPIYNGGITFNLGGGASSSGMGEFGALASAFGLGSSAPDANIFMGDNFMIYAKSRPVVEKTLMKTVKIKGKDTLLVNYYIFHSGIRDKEWEDSDSLQTFYFDRAKTPQEMTKQELIAMAQIYNRITTGEMGVTQPERKSSFMRLQAGMEDEDLTKVFIETHLETIEEDYRYKQTKKSREVLDLLHKRTDSLRNALSGTENRLARQIDQNQQVVVAQAQIQETKLTRNSTFLSQQYFSALQSEDNMRMSMIKEAPLFTEIEPVSLPLYKEVRTSIAMQAGVLLGLIISIVIVFFRETYRSIMQEG